MKRVGFDAWQVRFPLIELHLKKWTVKSKAKRILFEESYFKPRIDAQLRICTLSWRFCVPAKHRKHLRNCLVPNLAVGTINGSQVQYERMTLVDSASHYTPQAASGSAKIVEVKDASVGADSKPEAEDFKRAILLDHWRRRLRMRDFVDRLLAKEEKEVKARRVRYRVTPPQSFPQPPPSAPLRMHFGAKIENGLMTEDHFCCGRQKDGSLDFSAPAGTSVLSASAPVLSSSLASPSSTNTSLGWNWLHLNGLNENLYNYYSAN